ncbi:ABC-three component system protein [Catenulispora sp. MAP12-49]|uniref:ABC-three component system protein n=1 Tax=Catenulispora sp. MAP12-49 TaxID=3156302 RepID=UPI003514A173
MSGPVFIGIPEPAQPSMVLLTPRMQGAPVPTPRHYLHFYSDQEWEEFTVEWVRALGEPYVLVTRMGGAGDRGADVAACLTDQGTGGPWHCYQCKHYAEALRPADVWPEIAKIFLAKVQGTYELPAKYIFVAPKIGPTLARLLVAPERLKSEFFKVWDKQDSPLGAEWDAADRVAVGLLARSTSFSIFKPVDMDLILQLHATTPHHARRFPTVLKTRPDVPTPPEEQAGNEAVYIQKLLTTYNQKHGLSLTTLAEAREHLKTKEHVARQRQAFFSAEALRVFARDSVPPGTYAAIEDDLFEAVIEVEERDYDTGFERLDAVLQAAANHAPNPGNILQPIVTVRDRKGLCHQLANEDRLTWCKDDGGEST